MKRTTFVQMILSACLFCLCFASQVAAQTVTGSLVGTVTDPNSSAVPGARVVITEITRGITREATTNEEGNYTFSSLDPGVYRVEIEAPGFGKFTRATTEVAINTTVRVDAQLTTGEVAENVDVTADAVLLKTDRADVSQQITVEQVQELPLSADRNYQAALEIIPGVSPAEPVGSAFGNPGGSLINNVNGQNERSNNFQLDGTINNQTNVISQTAIVPPPEAIQIVDVSTNAYDAEQGRATGAVTNVQIRSGTNDFHGNVFIFNTNSALAARETFASEKPHTNLTQFGFTFGGPINRNKTFFFGDYQGGRDRQGQNTTLSVPSLAFRRGDFSSALGRPLYIQSNNTFGVTVTSRPAILTDTSGNRIQVREGQVYRLSDRAPYAGNIIPEASINPVARRILALLPPPTGAGETSNYESSGTRIQDRDQFDIKINHNFTERTTGFARYSYFQANTEDRPVFGALGGPTAAGGATAAIGPSRIQGASLNLTHVFSPKLVTEFRIGLVRVLIQGDTPTEPDLATQLGIPNVNLGDFFTPGIPRIGISGYTFLGAATTLPFKIAETSYQGVNNWTLTKGNHTIRFGADIRNLILNKFQAGGSNPRGEFTFETGPASRTGAPSSFVNAFASFLLDLPTQIRRTTVNQLGGYRIRQYFFYAQDRWQVNQKLTVNYGLRYEVQPYSVTANPGNQSRYDPETNQVLIGGVGSTPVRLGVRTDYTNFAPRLGVAYRLNDKTVLRAGYGISYVPLAINQLVNQSYPAQVDLQLQGTTTPVGSLSTGVPVVPSVDTSSGVVTPPIAIVVAALNPNPRRGYSQSFNGTIERDIKGFIAQVSYVGSLGTRLPGSINLNAVAPRADRRVTIFDRPFAVRFGRTADVLYHDYMLSASYHSLQTRLERRFGGNSKITASYTFAKSLDYTDAFTVSTPLNIDASRGPSDFDRRHNFVFSHVIRLPFGRGERFFDENGLTLGGLFGGFTISGILSIRSGAPIDITGVNSADNRPIGFTNRPTVNGPVQILGTNAPTYFDTSAFSDPAQGTIGNVGRNSVRGPGYFNYNLALSRIFDIRENVHLQLRIDAFNLTNTPRYADPSGSFTSGNFGRITDTVNDTERRIRLGLKLSF
ncbi:MAG: TonB-dependent receptor [Pyrinomonadaceae bacterium]|nr:TonB-dependent receptor [Pyrinomonadaceae bacterium]